MKTSPSGLCTCSTDPYSAPIRKQTCHQPHKQQEETKMFASPRREIPSSQCSSHCTLQQGMGKHHQDCGGGGEGCSMSSLRCSYKLGITLFFVHLVEGLEHILLSTCKRNESMQGVCTGSLERQPLTYLNKHRSRIQIC